MVLRIDEILREKNITNREFARRMGKKPQYTNAVIRGRSGVSLRMLNKMAEVLEVSIKDMFN